MGCQNSKAGADLQQGGSAGDGGAPLTTREIQERIEAPDRSHTLAIGGYRIRYAYISQRGFYPDERDKANQDCYSVVTKFDGNEDRALFTVFDGHGKEGDLCATFCRDHLPDNVATMLRAARTVEAGLTKAFLDTNEQLHADQSVDDSLSGTTAVSVYLDGRDMYVANVGDSRAILVQDQDGKLIAKPLSSDQTPYRKDERERVKQRGARVMSMDQIEGLEPIHENWGDVNLGEELDEGGDPPRIWSPFGEYPGTAFTRSMGDVIAEDLGVCAEPEIIRRRVNARDRFIIIASDGVFEFLTNQSVANMVSSYADPLDACKKVVQEAYDLWLQYEVRTDDITIICIFLEGVKEDQATNGFSEVDMDKVAQDTLRPVRREMSRQRLRQMIVSHESFMGSPSSSRSGKGATLASSEDASYIIEDNVTQKTAAERQSILHAIQSNFLFEHIPEAQRQVLADVFRRVPVRAGERVIRQGDPGDKFYIIESGKFEVRVRAEGPPPRGEEGKEAAGVVVHAYEATADIKPCFGHLALLYSKPRSASVFALTDGVLWSIDRPVFRRIIMRKSRREIVKTLRRVDVLRSLTLQQVQQLCDVLTEVTFEPGQRIIKQGEVGDTFFVIDEGTVTVTETDESGAERNVRRMRPHDYFGERALLLKEPRSANVTAERRVRCLQISQKAFEDVLGPLQHIIDEDRRRREARLGAPPLADLRILGIVAKDELGQTNLCRLPNGAGGVHSLRTMWKAEVAALKQRQAVQRAIDLLRHATEHPAVRMGCVAVPGLLGTYNSERGLHILQPAAIACSLAALLEERQGQTSEPLAADAVRHLGACVTLGLDALHRANVLYRALSPELVMLDGRGYAVLTEFRLAHLGLEGAQTLCGTPEYLAPEQVRHQGHGRAADFWALGILIYELSSGASPFAAESEMDTYHKITSLKAGEMVYPASFTPALCDLLDRLLHPDPTERLGARAGDLATLRTHQWFAGFDWGGVAKGECANADLQQVAREHVQRAARAESALLTEGKPAPDKEDGFDSFD